MFLPQKGFYGWGVKNSKNPFDEGGVGFETFDDYLPDPGMGGAPPTPIEQQPKPPSALDRMAELEKRRPMQSDPLLKPKPIERVLGGLAAAGTGFAAGYLNSGPRGPVVDPNAGGVIGSAIVNRKWNKANRDWTEKMDTAKTQAGIEQAKTEAEQKTEYNKARTASENAQREYAESMKRKAETPKAPTPPKPMESDPTKEIGVYVDGEYRVVRPAKDKPLPTPSTVAAMINSIRANPNLTDEQKRAQIDVVVADHNSVKSNSKVFLQADDNGNLTVIDYDPKSKKATAAPAGRHGKTKSEPTANARYEESKSVEAEANRLLKENNGDYKAAYAAADLIAVKNVLADMERKKNSAEGKKSKGLTIDGKTYNVSGKGGNQAAGGAKDATKKTPPPGAPTATNAKGEKVYWDGQKWQPIG